MTLTQKFKNFIRITSYYYLKLFFRDVYAQDLLISFHNHDFMKEPDFLKAYNRGLRSGHKLIEKYPWFHNHWRVHVALWVASQVRSLQGDFVECGVNRGVLSSTVMTYLKWNTMDKHFFLFDTFQGIDEALVSEEEKKLGRLEIQSQYEECYQEVKNNFAEFDRVHLVRGTVPETLSHPDISKVCYVHLDMNNTYPELAAADFFWDKLVSGGIVLLDDYAYEGYLPQKKAHDKFAAEKNVPILSLPTGQGFYIKP